MEYFNKNKMLHNPELLRAGKTMSKLTISRHKNNINVPRKMLDECNEPSAAPVTETS